VTLKRVILPLLAIWVALSLWTVFAWNAGEEVPEKGEGDRIEFRP
jgi:hypothetical protein